MINDRIEIVDEYIYIYIFHLTSFSRLLRSG